MTLEDALKLNFPLTIVPAEEGGFVGYYADLPGVVTQAETVEELMAMAEEARALWIALTLENGQAIPLPGSRGSTDEYSGKFNLRVPKSLHRQLAERAEREGVSLNQWVVTVLAQATGP